MYIGKTYVANNLVFDNGGRGIHCYSSNKVIIVNNTCYQNCQSPSVKDGEFTAYSADSIWFINNIALPSPGISPIHKSNSTTTNLTVDHNLWAANSVLTNPYGTDTVTASPDFILPSSNPLLADFHLQTSSAARNTGTHFYAPTTDKGGHIRLLTDSVDIGCYELPPTSGNVNLNRSQNLFAVFPNPATASISMKILDTASTQIKVEFYNSIGEKIKTSKATTLNGIATFYISQLQNGIYFIQTTVNYNETLIGRFVKTQ